MSPPTGHRLTACPLQAHEPEDRHQVSDMKRAEGRVEPVVGADRLVRGEARLEARGHVVDEASPAQVGQEIRQVGRAHAVTPGAGRTSKHPGSTERGFMTAMLS